MTTRLDAIGERLRTVPVEAWSWYEDQEQAGRVATVLFGEWDESYPQFAKVLGPDAEALAEFIIHSRTDIEALLAVVDAAARFIRDDYLGLISDAGGTSEGLEALKAAIVPLLEKETE